MIKKTLDALDDFIQTGIGQLNHYREMIDPVGAAQRERARLQIQALNGFSGASKTRKSMRNWNIKKDDPGQILLDDLGELVERSEDLDRNNPMASGAVTTLKTNVVGCGLRVQSRIDSEFLGIPQEQAETFQKNAERIFNLVANRRLLDANRRLSFDQMQGVAYVSQCITGDAFAQRIYDQQRAKNFLGTSWRMFDSSRVCNPDDVSDSPLLKGGIGFTEAGAPKSVHVRSVDPDDRHKRGTWKEYQIHAADGMNLDIIHMFSQRLTSECRGRPIMTPVIEAFKTLGRYTEAELQAAVVSALFTVFVKTKSGHAEVEFRGDDEQVKSVPTPEMGYGSIVGLAEDEEIETANPGRPNDSFDPFVMSILRQIGVALGLPFELLVKHFTSSYSASRAALNEAQKMFRESRKALAFGFCQPMYESIIIEAVASGRLYAPGFFNDFEVRCAYLDSVWTGDSFGTLDPVKDVSASEKRINLGLSTRTQETLEINGGDYERNHAQRLKESKMESQITGGQDEPSVDSDIQNGMVDNGTSPAEPDQDSEQAEPKRED